MVGIVGYAFTALQSLLVVLSMELYVFAYECCDLCN